MRPSGRFRGPLPPPRGWWPPQLPSFVSHLPPGATLPHSPSLPPALPFLSPSPSCSFISHTLAFPQICSPTSRYAVTFTKISDDLPPLEMPPPLGVGGGSPQPTTPEDGANQRTWPGTEQGSHLPTRRCGLTSGQVRAVGTETGCSLEPHRTPVATLSCRGARWEMRLRRKWGHTLERQAGAAGPGRQDGARRWPASASRPHAPSAGSLGRGRSGPLTEPPSEPAADGVMAHAVHRAGGATRAYESHCLGHGDESFEQQFPTFLAPGAPIRI